MLGAMYCQNIERLSVHITNSPLMFVAMRKANNIAKASAIMVLLASTPANVVDSKVLVQTVYSQCLYLRLSRFEIECDQSSESSKEIARTVFTLLVGVDLTFG